MIIHIIVFTLVPANITESPTNLTVNQSFSAEFSCTAFGNPIPQIVWSREEDSDLSDNVDTINIFLVVNDTQYTITSILLINSTMRSRDAGMYNCTTRNNVPNYINADNIQIAELVVQGKLFNMILTCHLMFFCNLVPPLVVPLNSSVIGVEGNSIVFTFNVINAFPPVTINNVRWLLNREGNTIDITNSTMVDNNTLIYIFETNSTTQMYSLTISNIQPNYTSRINLTVSNPAGMDSSFTDIIVEGNSKYLLSMLKC